MQVSPRGSSPRWPPRYRRNHWKPGRRPRRFRGAAVPSGPSQGSRRGSDHSHPVLVPPAPIVRAAPRPQPQQGQNGGSVMNHAHLLAAEGLPHPQAEGPGSSHWRGTGQVWGLWEGGCTFLCAPRGLLRAESALRHEPVIATLSPFGKAFLLRGRPALWDNTSTLSPGRAFSSHREVGPFA